MNQINYLQHMYDLWEDKQNGTWEEIETFAEFVIEKSDATDKPSKLAELKALWEGKVDITNAWWALPEWLKALVKPLTKLHKSWVMPVYKTSADGLWYMDIPMLMTWKESLCGGTELVLDKWYTTLTGQQVTAESKMTLTLSKHPTDDATTTLSLVGKDEYMEGASYYKDDITKMSIWLCPYLPWLMGGIPDVLYVTMKPV